MPSARQFFLAADHKSKDRRTKTRLLQVPEVKRVCLSGQPCVSPASGHGYGIFHVTGQFSAQPRADDDRSELGTAVYAVMLIAGWIGAAHRVQPCLPYRA